MGECKTTLKNLNRNENMRNVWRSKGEMEREMELESPLKLSPRTRSMKKITFG